MLDISSDPSARRPLKLILIGTLAIGALASLSKPVPPAGFPFWLMAPAWTLNYILMAIAAWLAWKRGGWRTWAMTLYAGQLVLGLFWRAWPGAVLATILILLMLMTLAALFRRNAAAALAFLPCLAWIVFLALSGPGRLH